MTPAVFALQQRQCRGTSNLDLKCLLQREVGRVLSYLEDMLMGGWVCGWKEASEDCCLVVFVDGRLALKTVS
jgi:hypothetical protein